MKIERRSIGQTKVGITNLGLGGGPFGNLFDVVADADLDDCVNAAYAAGLRYFDTSPYYGFGLSERRVGDALRRYQDQGFTLSTKVGRILEPLAGGPSGQEKSLFKSPMPFRPRFDYSYDGVMRSYEASLQRLGLGKIDILLFHDLSKDMHEPEVLKAHFADVLDSGMRAAQELKASGDIGAVGFGVNFPDIPQQAFDRVPFDCVLLASRYTALEDRSEGLLDQCLSRGIAVIAAAPFNSGVLVTGSAGAATYDHVPAQATVLDKVRQLEALCASHAVPLAAVALQFPSQHPAVTSVLPGARTAREIREIIGWMEIEIPASLWTDLAALTARW